MKFNDIKNRNYLIEIFIKWFLFLMPKRMTRKPRACKYKHYFRHFSYHVVSNGKRGVLFATIKVKINF